MPWVYDPHSGGTKLTPSNQAMFLHQANAFAETRPWFSIFQLKLRFQNQFCYVDAFKRNDEQLFPLCRLRYFRRNIWSMAFYTYSNERYEPCCFHNGTLEGSLEEAIEMCEMYLTEDAF